MKTSMLIALMTEGFSLVSVRFRREGGGQSSKAYHYKYPGFDVAVGDMVVVESPHDGFVIVDVESVDTDPVLDTNAGFSYKWVVQKIDTADYYAHREREMALCKHLRRLQNKAEAERTLTAIREELKNTEAGREFEALVEGLNVGAKPQAQVTDESVPASVQISETVGGIPFIFWPNTSGPAIGRWNFSRHGCAAVHKGFASYSEALHHAARMVANKAIK